MLCLRVYVLLVDTGRYGLSKFMKEKQKKRYIHQHIP